MTEKIEDLTKKKCVPCEGGILPLEGDELTAYSSQCTSWVIDRTEIPKIRREFVFPDFKGAVSFVNRVADIAEDEGHHPDIHLFYNKLILELYTHAVSGLTENDFIMAAKINKIRL